MFDSQFNDLGGGLPSDKDKMTMIQEWRQVKLMPNSPISLERRATLMALLTRSLEFSPLVMQSIALSILYFVAEGAPGAQADRLSTYIRWRLVFGAATDDVANQRVLREFRAEVASAQANLRVYADLERVEREALDEHTRLRAIRSPLAEAHFSHWPATSDWLAPSHAQPMIDALIGQAEGSALQFTLERQACDTVASGPCLRFGVVAAGAATNPGALCALAAEMSGCGRLAPMKLTDCPRPTLECFVAQSAKEHAHLYANLVNQSTRPWTTCAEPPTHVALTSNEAALLAPLPMILGEWFGF